MPTPNQTIETKDTSPTAKDIDPVENPVVEKKDVSTKDNTEKISQIEANITEIKSSVASLKTEIEDLDKSKSTLSKEVLTTKEKEIEDKKTAIEAKKTETQALIDAVRKDRIDLKLETLDADTKTVVEAQKVKEETLLSAYESDLKAIEVTKKTFWEKAKDKASKSRERVKENPGKTVIIATGVGLLVGWMAGWFKKKKKSGEGDKDGEEKKEGFWNHGVGRFLKYAGIGVAGFFGIKWLIKQFKGDEKDNGNGAGLLDVLSSTSNGVESYKKLKESDKTELTKVGDNVNELYSYVDDFGDGTKVEGLDKEKLGGGDDKYSGVIPHVLDNTFATIDDMESEKGLFEVGAYGDASEIGKKFAGCIAKGVANGTGWLVNNTLGMVIGAPKLVSGDTEATIETKISTFLSGSNGLDEVHLLYRKIFKTMAYLHYAENAFMGQKIETLLKGGSKLYEKSGDDREVEDVDTSNADDLKKLIKKIIESPSDYKIGEKEVETMRKTEFRGKKISAVADDGITKDVLLQYNPDIKEDIDDINKERKEKIDLLATDQGKALDKMINNAESEMADSFFKGLTKWIPVAHLLEYFNVGKEEEVKQKIMEKGGYKELLTEYKKGFTDLKTETDTTKIKAKIDQYYAQLKDLTVTAGSMYVMQDKDGNTFLYWMTPIYNIFAGEAKLFVGGIPLMIQGVEEVASGKPLTGSRDFTKGVYSLAIGSGALMLLWSRTRGYGLKLMFAPISIPTKLVWSQVKPYAKVGTAEVFRPWITRNVLRMYRTPENIRLGLLRGMSSESAFKLYKMSQNVTTSAERGFAESLLNVTDKDELDMMTNMVKKERFAVIDNMIETKKFILTAKSFSLRNGLDKLKPVYTLLEDATTDAKVQKFGYKLLEKTDAKNRLKVKELLSNKDIVDEIKNIKNADDMAAIAKKLGKSIGKMGSIDATGITTCKDIIKNGMTSTTTIDVWEDVIEDALKNKAAYKVWESRTKGTLMEEFESTGKYRDYPEFKAKYAAAKTEAELTAVDSDFAKKLLQDGKNLDVLLGLSEDQKGVYTLVKKDVTDIETKIAGLSRKTGNTATTELAYKTKLKNIRSFERQLGDFNPEEITAFKSLNKLEFKTYHIIELLQLKKTNPAIESALKEPDLDNIVKVLKNEKGVSAELIEGLEAIRSKPLMKGVKAVAEFLTLIAKFLKFIPK